MHLRDRADITADVLVGADGINSFVRRQLWGDQPIRHQKLHLVAGYLFTDAPDPVMVVAHNRSTQGSYSAIRHDGQSGYECGYWRLSTRLFPSRGICESSLSTEPEDSPSRCHH